MTTLKARTLVIKDWLLNKADVDIYQHRQAIGRGLMIVYHNQTADEKRDKQTKYHNDKGFCGNNANFGTSVAEAFKLYGDLTPRQAFRVKKMLARHARQIARAKLEEEAKQSQ